MKSLLNNRYAPVTFSWGFLEKPLEELVEFQIKWSESLQQAHATKRFAADLPRALESLEPLNVHNVLLTSTKSSFTAVFQGCVGSTSPRSQINYPVKQLQCRGLIVTCVEDSFNDKTKTGLYGGVSFELFAPHRTSHLNTERVVSAIHDTGGWVFHTFGNPKDFENIEAYSRRKKRDRLTDDMLEEYCAALGISLFDPGFYGPDCGLIYSTAERTDMEKTYDDVQIKLGLKV